MHWKPLESKLRIVFQKRFDKEHFCYAAVPKNFTLLTVPERQHSKLLNKHNALPMYYFRRESLEKSIRQIFMAEN